MPNDPLFDFAVPEDLLREAVSQVRDADVVRGPRGHARDRRGQAAPTDRHPQDLGLRPPGAPHGGGSGAGNLRERNRPHRQEPRDFVPHVQRVTRRRSLHRPGLPAPVGRPAGGVGRPRQPEEGGGHRPADFCRLRQPDGDLAQRLGVRVPVSGRLYRHRCEQHGAQLIPLGRLSHRVRVGGSSAGTTCPIRCHRRSGS